MPSRFQWVLKASVLILGLLSRSKSVLDVHIGEGAFAVKLIIGHTSTVAFGSKLRM